jgi:3-deoxy-7-phosphoheptulonate synthase
MVIVMQENATANEIAAVDEKLQALGFQVHRSTGVTRTILGAVGEKRDVDLRELELMQGVYEVVRITEPYKLVGRAFRPENTLIHIKDVVIGQEQVILMAGPCAVESQEQILEIASIVKKSGATVLRGGAFKPRSSPYSFQGLGEPGLRYLKEAGDQENLVTVSEVMDNTQVDTVAAYIDILQVGARNMHNYSLLKELGKINKPILLKRGIAATIEEWLMAAEYVMSGGNDQIILCERGIRTFEKYTRNTLDISAIPVIKKLSHLPIIVDPSHATGIRNKVAPMARAAVAAGADGLLIEVHNHPDKALSDGAQSLYPEQFDTLVSELKIISQAIGKSI